MSDTRFAVFETLPIFFDGQHSLRIHQMLRMPRLLAVRAALAAYKDSSPSGKTLTQRNSLETIISKHHVRCILKRYK
jgi:hypothetical protein